MEKLSEKRLNILIEAASAGIYPPGVRPMNIDEKLSVLLDYKQLRAEKQRFGKKQLKALRHAADIFTGNGEKCQ